MSKTSDKPPIDDVTAAPDNVAKLGTHSLEPMGLTFDGQYTFEQWRKLGSTLRDLRDHVMFWLGDWWNYGETVYGEMSSQEARDELEIETGYTYNTVRTAAWVCQRLPFEERLSGVSFKHHHVVSPIEDKDVRADLLAQARANQWTVAQLEDAARPFKKTSKAAAKDAGLFDDDKFTLVYADPPWKFENTTTPNRRAENQYPTMSTVDICALRDGSGRPIQDILAKNAVLFLWTTSSKIEEALQVVNAWGFAYQTQIIWDKEKQGLGHYARQEHEILTIATKGQPGTPTPKDRPPSVLTITKLQKWLGVHPQKVKLQHSEKPAEFRLMIERMYRKAVRIELFARHAAKGWSRYGLESPASDAAEKPARKKKAS
jgi:N6-adenosine-specific RNA methylase IME4